MIERLVTQRCAAHGHPELVLAFDADRLPRGDAVSVATWLEESVASGVRFEPSQTIQIGWSLTRLAEERPGLLALEEPDFASMPIRWVPGVTTTLRHLRLQKDVAASLGVAPDFSSILLPALVCSRVPERPPGGMSRFPADPSLPNDSGWFIGCAGPGHDHGDPAEIRRESLYAIACFAPSLVPYLAMPGDWTVVFGEDQAPHFRFKGEPRDPLPGSLVDALRRRDG